MAFFIWKTIDFLIKSRKSLIILNKYNIIISKLLNTYANSYKLYILPYDNLIVKEGGFI